jgi:hypothetical protein
MVFPLLIHAFSLWITVQTPGLTIQSKTRPPLFHTTADVPSRHPYELPSAFHLNFSVPIQQKPSNLHHNLCDNVILLSGSLMWGRRPGHPRFLVLLLPCLNLVQTVIIHMLHLRMNVRWSCTYLHTENGWQRHACSDNSVTVLQWATSCCAEITQSRLLMMFAYHGQ